MRTVGFGRRGERLGPTPKTTKKSGGLQPRSRVRGVRRRGGGRGEVTRSAASFFAKQT